ncbi:MAG: hypothetical protein IJQ59_02590 [Bacteroidaceae bacterium]|nr:hypothetical protein [Bacteroidaceae bacterium]
MKRRLQNKIAESTATLPVAFIIMTALWWWPQHGDLIPLLLGWLTCVATTYFLLEANAKYAILRIRTQMMSALYLLLMAVCTFLHPMSTGNLCQLCLVIAFYCMLHTYGDSHAETHTFHAVLALSIGSLFWAPLLWLMPVLLWCQGVYLRALNLRNLGAALCALLLPYLVWGTALTAKMSYAYLTSSVVDQLPAIDYFQPLLHHAEQMIAPFHEPITFFNSQFTIDNSFDELRINQFFTLHSSLFIHLFAALVVGLLGLTGFIHYLRKSYDDKIQVRMYHYSFMTVQVVVAIWMVLQPHYFHQLFPLFIAATVPAAAHFIALTHTWLTNAWFILLTLLLASIFILTY